MNKAKWVADGIDSINRWIGEKASLLLIPLMGIALLEVILRYAFNRPTIWAWDVNIQLGAALISLTGAYILLDGLFVRVDIVISRLPPRLRLWVDLVTSVVPLFAVGILVKLGIEHAWRSSLAQEHLSTTWMPPIYPLRIVVAIGFVLLFLQIIANVIRSVLGALGYGQPIVEPK